MLVHVLLGSKVQHLIRIQEHYEERRARPAQAQMNATR